METTNGIKLPIIETLKKLEFDYELFRKNTVDSFH